METAKVKIRRVNDTSVNDTEDVLATEEPLEIRLEYHDAGRRIVKSVSVTMRTPGHDTDLAIGFLYTEGIVRSASEIRDVDQVSENVVKVSLKGGVVPEIAGLERNFYTTSSCGVCGKASIEAVYVACSIIDTKDNITISAQVLYGLPEALRASQNIFGSTGGLHGCALFSLEGSLMESREDVGRHNALDKLIGFALMNGRLPLQQHILLLSGRASFELVQKAAMAGIKLIAAVGAPSSLAVQLADDRGITLAGFLRGERFNIYSGAQRIVI
jgi:FdhD protein